MKKISKLQILRFITQIGFLFFLPSLFTLTFSQLKQAYLMIAKGNFNLSTAFPQLLEVSILITLTIFLGRFFCGWMCAFGTFNDIIYLLFNKIFKVKFIVNERVHSILKHLKYMILIFIILAVWIKDSKSLDIYSPWNAFAQFTQFTEAIQLYPIGFIILALIVIGAMFVERFFCRYLCPLGAIFAITSKLRFFKIHKHRENCGKCKICTNNCSMGIKLYEVDVVNSWECINCMKCINSCPRNNTQTKMVGKKVSPAFVSGLVVIAFMGLYSVSIIFVDKIDNGNMGLTTSNNSSAENSKSSSSGEGKKYNDGTYVGVGRGYRPNVKVSVTIKNNKITDIQIVSNNETPRYAEIPFNTIPKEIIDSQSTDVDTVSGATRTSNGIMEAVKNALSQAETNKSTESNSTEESSKTEQNNNGNIVGNQSNEPNIEGDTSSNENNYQNEVNREHRVPSDRSGEGEKSNFDGNHNPRGR